jgi:hypothetical protein
VISFTLTSPFSWIPDQVPLSLRLPVRQPCGVRQYYTIKPVSTAIVSQNNITLVLTSRFQLLTGYAGYHYFS